MKTRLLLIAAVLAAPLAPAAAESLHKTHEKVWMPAGKTIPLYRQIKRDTCRDAVPHRPAGKIGTHAAAPDAACAQIAARQGKSAASAGGEQ